MPRNSPSERAFERFLAENNLPFERIEEEVSPTPDYFVKVGNCKVAFEVKELLKDSSFREINDRSSPVIRTHSRTLGKHVRDRIHSARKQIQFAAAQGFPSILLVYNSLDPFHLFGTEDSDFLHGMYGLPTLFLDKDTMNIKREMFFGGKKSFLPDMNTSFSAVGRLAPIAGRMTVTLFENAFARVRLPYEQLPPCFEAKRVVIT